MTTTLLHAIIFNTIIIIYFKKKKNLLVIFRSDLRMKMSLVLYDDTAAAYVGLLLYLVKHKQRGE